MPKFDLRAYRQSLGLTMSDFALAAGLSKNTVWHAEKDIITDTLAQTVIDRLKATYGLEIASIDATTLRTRPNAKMGRRAQTVSHGVYRGGVSRLELIEQEWLNQLQRIAAELDIDRTANHYKTLEGLVEHIWECVSLLGAISPELSESPDLESQK
jgi:DNA-binding XRE family transcriptional regulator